MRQETPLRFHHADVAPFYLLAGDPAAVEGGAFVVVRAAVEGRVGVHVDGVAPLVPPEELFPQRRHGQVPLRQEQERHLGPRAQYSLPRRRRSPRHQLLIVVVPNAGTHRCQSFLLDHRPRLCSFICVGDANNAGVHRRWRRRGLGPGCQSSRLCYRRLRRVLRWYSGGG